MKQQNLTLSSRYRRARLPILLGMLGIGCYVAMALAPLHWETRIRARVGALQLSPERNVASLTLTLADRKDLPDFYFLSSRQEVDAFWRVDPDKKADGTDKKREPCGRVPGATNPSCSSDNGVVVLKGKEGAEWLLVAAAPSSEKDAGGNAQKVSNLRWDRVKIEYAGDRKRILEVTPSDCSLGRGDREKCVIIDGLLGHPLLVNGWDPQRLVVKLAHVTSTNVVPALVGFMSIVDFLLLIFLVYWNGKLWRAAGRGPLPVDPLRTPRHYDEQLPGLRRSLELLEVSGPAIAFALTVAALMVAFDPSVFEERRTAQFAGNIGLAMAATACGLLMRILSFSLDRTVEHWLRLQSDEDGFAVLPSPEDSAAPQPTAPVPTVAGSSGSTI